MEGSGRTRNSGPGDDAMSATGIDERKLEAFMDKAVGDMGAVISAPLMTIGERLGLYRAMAGAGPLTSAELAERTDVAERSVREWLANQAAGGYVTYDPESDRYTLPDEQALALADEDSPFYILGAFELIASLYADESKILEAFKSGAGMGWHEHDDRLFRGTERFFRPGLPRASGRRMDPRARRGAGQARARRQGGRRRLRPRRLDGDHGQGVSRPASFTGSTTTPSRSSGRARSPSRRAWPTGVSFQVATAKDYPGSGYDLVCVFDCLHDMGDPVGASAHVLETLAPDGTWMIVEPFAGDRLQDNLNPVGRVFYGASTMICTPASLDQEVGLALGAQAGEARLRDVVTQVGSAACAGRRRRRST